MFFGCSCLSKANLPNLKLEQKTGQGNVSCISGSEATCVIDKTGSGNLPRRSKYALIKN